MMHSNVAVLLGIGGGGAIGLFLGVSQGSLCREDERSLELE
ncbi:hypothetical protein [Vibrio crassostreae]|nr:hypothetical protein [Vibrio crassostreae]